MATAVGVYFWELLCGRLGVGASSYFILLLSLWLTSIPASRSSAFDRVLDDVNSCRDSCHSLYESHSPLDVKHSECCERGCRFFSIVEFIHNHDDINATKDACTSSCMEAYSQTGDRYACNMGCSKQLPFAVEKRNKARNETPKMHWITPFMFVRNIYETMVDRVSRLMSVDWSFYVQKDNGKVIVVQSEPEVIGEYFDVDEVDYTRNQEESSKDLTDVSDTNFLRRPDLSLERIFAGSNGYGEHQDVARGRITNGDDLNDLNNNLDWLGCVARKSGLPRWLIGLTILSSALAMIWLCFTTTATVPEHILRSQKVNMYQDLECLKVNCPEKVRIQPNQEEEGTAFPLKIELLKA